MTPPPLLAPALDVVAPVAGDVRPPSLVTRLARRKVLDALDGWTGAPLTVVLPDGTRREVGVGDRATAPTLTVRDPAFFRKVALHGRLGLGEAYVDGDWEADDLEAVLAAGLGARAVARRPLLERVQAFFAPRRLVNDRAGSRRNIHAHYDLGNAFYALWLDPTLTYSAAMFAAPDDDLEVAQRRKIAAMAAKACVRAGDRVLEIGCGWGAFALHAAGDLGAHVTGLTISAAQHEVATARVRAAGLADRVDVRLEDWRDTRGTFDAIVSVEMFEAVGRGWWRPWFEAVDRLLAPEGVASVQVICHPDAGFARYASRTDWIERYIFPGSLLGSLGAFHALLARHTRLRIVGVEDLAPSYALTLRRWRERFVAQLPFVRALGFDERFVRTWTYYLAVCEAAFRTGHLHDFQLQLAREGSRLAGGLGTTRPGGPPP